MAFVFYVASILVIMIMILAYITTKSKGTTIFSNKKEYFIAYLLRERVGNNVWRYTLPRLWIHS